MYNGNKLLVRYIFLTDFGNEIKYYQMYVPSNDSCPRAVVVGKSTATCVVCATC